MEFEDAKTLHHRRESQRHLIVAHQNKFRGPDGGIHPEIAEDRTCPVCDADQPIEVFVKNGGRYVRCAVCGMIYLNPVLKDDALLLYYSFNTTIQAISHRLERPFYAGIYRKGLEQIHKTVKVGRVLDIGCSSGLFLDVAKEEGWQTFGTELNAAEREIAQDSKHMVWSGLIEEIPADERFDLITLWDVFEHLKHGRRFLDSAAKRLLPGGAVFLQIPNGGALAARILQEKCNMFDGIEHMCLYSPDTITKLVDSAGWRMLSMGSVIDELKPVLNYLNYEQPYTGSFSFPQQFPFFDPKTILDLMFGYKLQVLVSPK